MKFLLDTHALLWFLDGDARLSSSARALIENPHHELFVSVASLWEIAIKVSLGKLTLIAPFETLFPEQLNHNRIEVLGISLEHLHQVTRLPFHHRDPFDRLLLAQAQVEDWPLISVDAVFDLYAVSRQW